MTVFHFSSVQLQKDRLKKNKQDVFNFAHAFPITYNAIETPRKQITRGL
jgi:ketol-acid reductoisomerase